jgi:putative DNA primase/helicase
MAVAANLDSVLARLKGVRRNGNGWQALCPAHEDRNPSLSVHERDGRILLHCHAGCTPEAVCTALGIELRELFTDATSQGSEARVAATYDYVNEHGKLIFQVVRYEPKDFRQRRPDGRGGWIWNMDGVRRVLYRLPDLLGRKSVLIVEGEKDCETARKLGRVATSNPGGAGKWREEYSESLRGKRIVIIADAEEAGRKHAQQVATSLYGKVESLKVLELPGAKDLTEWIERGGTGEALLELIRSATEWKLALHQEECAGRITLVSAEVFLSRSSSDEKPWLAEGLLPASSQTIWQGRPKVGKSHTLLQLAFDLSCGLPVFGYFPAPRPVRCAYVELEEPEGITKSRYAGILRGHGGQGPNAENLVFLTREDLWRLGFLPRELSGSRTRDFISALRDRGTEFLILIALRRLAQGKLKDEDEAERLNDALDTVACETGAGLALGHHSRKEEAETVEAQGIGSTFISARADGTFDLARAGDGVRKVKFEGRFEAPELFFLRKEPVGDGEVIQWVEAPPDPKKAKRDELIQRVNSGDSIRRASESLEVKYSTAQRWVSETKKG